MKSSQCQSRDQDILLYLHRELPALKRALLQAHLKRCDKCRARAAQMTSVSSILSAAVGSSRFRPESLSHRASVPKQSKRLRIAVVALALLVIGFSVAKLVVSVRTTLGACDPIAPAGQAASANGDPQATQTDPGSKADRGVVRGKR
jgi:anti-sigma factor RsiW